MLPRRAFGSTGIEVSVLGLGTVKLGRNQGVKIPRKLCDSRRRGSGEFNCLRQRPRH